MLPVTVSDVSLAFSPTSAASPPGVDSIAIAEQVIAAAAEKSIKKIFFINPNIIILFLPDYASISKHASPET